MSFALVLAVPFENFIHGLSIGRIKRKWGERERGALWRPGICDSKGVRVACLAYWFGKYNGSELNSPSVCGVCFFANNESGAARRRYGEAWIGWRRAAFWWFRYWERDTIRPKMVIARIRPIFWIISIREEENGYMAQSKRIVRR